MCSAAAKCGWRVPRPNSPPARTSSNPSWAAAGSGGATGGRAHRPDYQAHWPGEIRHRGYRGRSARAEHGAAVCAARPVRGRGRAGPGGLVGDGAGTDLEVPRSGSFLVARTDKHRDSLLAEATQSRGWGADVQQASPSDLAGRVSYYRGTDSGE